MKLFQFEKRDITNFLEYELKIFSKFKEPLNYAINTLEKLGHSITIKDLDKVDLNKVKEKEGKSYHWSVFKYQDSTILVRRYRYHMTIFAKTLKTLDNGREKIEYGAFTFSTDFKKFGKDHDKMMDSYYDKPFTDLNVVIKDLFNLLIDKNYGVGWIWNSSCIKMSKQVDIKLAFDGKEVSSLDEFVFCMEELDSIYLELFAETTMLQKIKQYEDKIGTMLNDRYKIENVITEVKNDYFHGVGLSLIDTMSKEEGKSSFQDVYSLSRWYFKDVFKDGIYFYGGEVFVEGGELEAGKPAVHTKYKNEDDSVTIFEDTFPKENFTSLVKI